MALGKLFFSWNIKQTHEATLHVSVEQAKGKKQSDASEHGSSDTMPSTLVQSGLHRSHHFWRINRWSLRKNHFVSNKSYECEVHLQNIAFLSARCSEFSHSLSSRRGAWVSLLLVHFLISKICVIQILNERAKLTPIADDLNSNDQSTSASGSEADFTPSLAARQLSSQVSKAHQFHRLQNSIALSLCFLIY